MWRSHPWLRKGETLVMKQKTGPAGNVRVIATNRKARHEYHIDDTWEAGIVLRGTEVKSLRCGGGSVVDSYAEPEGGEIWLNNFHINPYEQGNRYNVDEKRRRKLLLNKKQIRKIVGLCTQKGYTLIPLRLYFLGQHVKVELALARGKKAYDKRQDIRERDTRRELDRDYKLR